MSSLQNVDTRRSDLVAYSYSYNSVPFGIRNGSSVASFRRKLKTFFFFQHLAMSSASDSASESLGRQQ